MKDERRRIIPTTRTALRRLQRFNQWAELNREASAGIKRDFDALPVPYQRRFLWLLRDNPPDDAMAHTIRLKEIMEKAGNGGYEFTTRMGVPCTVKRLDQDVEYAKKYRAASRWHDILKRERTVSTGYMRKIMRGSYLLKFSIDGSKFGLIYWLTVLNIPSRRLLTIIDCLKEGVTPGMASLEATFNDGEICLNNRRTHEPRRAAKIILKAVKQGIPPTICTLLHEGHDY
jgi:hypothetical protein